MKHYNSKSEKIHGEYIYTPGIGISPKAEQKDNGKAVELAKKVTTRRKVNSDDLERWK